MENITISMEEYKELLITKGKYEELKSQQISKMSIPLTREFELPKLNDYKITCKGE